MNNKCINPSMYLFSPSTFETKILVRVTEKYKCKKVAFVKFLIDYKKPYYDYHKKSNK